MSKLPINPFAENIVAEPRQIETPVTGLNDQALEKLTNAFEFLVKGPLPRINRRASHALLVTSVAAGYGKSHLLGRLFRKLEHRTTLIYVRPFQDPSSCWRSLLDRLVMELEYPDRADAVACAPGELSQLDVFARHVLDFLRNQSIEAFQAPRLLGWLRKHFGTLLRKPEQALKAFGVHLHGGNAWLKILSTYVREPASSLLRNACLDWIKYQPLEEEEARQIGLKTADLPQVDLPYEQRNQECCKRILDLLKLAAFYRPFVLCFDQTELYENSSDLAQAFGKVILQLRDDGENLLIVITANKYVWDNKIFNNFQEGPKRRIAPEIPLLGINRMQAQELASNRLRDWEVDENEIQAFLDAIWLDNLFEATPRISPSDFINKCSQRWKKEGKREEGGTEIVSSPDLSEVYQTYRAKFLHAPKSRVYDAGVLQWVFQTVFNGEPGLKTERFNSDKGYLSLCWIRDGACVYFGFEEGDHFKRWEAILNETKRYHNHDQHNHITSRSVFFRVPGQKPIPGQNWRIRAEFEKASQALAIFHLNQEEVASLYAAHDLYADVAQGNQPFAKEQTLRFLAKELHGWIARVVSGSSPVKPNGESKPLSPELIETLRSIVSTYPYLSLNMLQKKLAEHGLEADREQIFMAAEMIPEIKVFSTLTNAVFKWN
jgi:hypothetical protein